MTEKTPDELLSHKFLRNASWSLPEHLFQISEWSAKCATHNDPSRCVNAIQLSGFPPDFMNPTKTPPIYAWTDFT